MMNATFQDMLDEGWLAIYMDDILIFSQDLEEHHERTRRVVQRLLENVTVSFSAYFVRLCLPCFGHTTNHHDHVTVTT